MRVDIDSDSTCPAAFDATILYEDFATGLRGHLLATWLATRLGHEVKGNEHLWRFDVLNYPQCFRQAMEDSARSELIIVSAHGTIKAPSILVAWLDEWVVYHVDPLADVIVSLDPVPREGGPAPPFLDCCLNRLVRQLPCDLVLTYSEPAMVRKLLRRRASASHRNRNPIWTEGVLAGLLRVTDFRRWFVGEAWCTQNGGAPATTRVLQPSIDQADLLPAVMTSGPLPREYHLRTLLSPRVVRQSLGRGASGIAWRDYPLASHRPFLH